MQDVQRHGVVVERIRRIPRAGHHAYAEPLRTINAYSTVARYEPVAVQPLATSDLLCRRTGQPTANGEQVSDTNETIKRLAEKLKQAGIAGKDEFAKGVKDAAVEGAQDLLKAGPDVAGRYARTTLDMAALLADEALTGKHEPREWAQIDSQFASHNIQSAAILRAASLKFLKNVASILGGVLGGLGGTVGEAVAGTLDDLLKNIG